MFKAIILDMDGLMVDTERLYIRCNHEIARSRGKQVQPPTQIRMIGRSPVESLAIFAADLGLPDDPRELVAIRDQMMLDLVQTDLLAMPGLTELLSFARPRFRLAVATGSPRKLVDVVLDKLAIRPFFELIQTAEGIPNGKPDPEIFLRAVTKLRLPPGECIVLEDSENGVRAGRSAGCYTMAVPNSDTRQQNFAAAHFVAADLHAAREHIAALTVSSSTSLS